MIRRWCRDTVQHEVDCFLCFRQEVRESASAKSPLMAILRFHDAPTHPRRYPLACTDGFDVASRDLPLMDLERPMAIRLVPGDAPNDSPAPAGKRRTSAGRGHRGSGTGQAGPVALLAVCGGRRTALLPLPLAAHLIKVTSRLPASARLRRQPCPPRPGRPLPSPSRRP